MKKMLAFIFRTAPAVHDDTLRAGQFEPAVRYSPYIAMLPYH
ncbi:MAG TPA: hypothetical protein VMD47_05225 [Candidatus Acidoferrales bacterium]|nr:hypothetical protein [Candidatus Acidoferrales bacterium]